MLLPMLKPTKRRRILIDRFRGYEQTPAVSAGAFYDMKNLSGERAPLLCVRRRRTVTDTIDDCPTDCVLAMAGRSSPVVLDAHGTLWCGGQALPRLLDGRLLLSAVDAEGTTVPILRRELLLTAMLRPGSYELCYDAAQQRWLVSEEFGSLPDDVLGEAPRTDGAVVRVDYDYPLTRTGVRQMVFLGGWVCIFPDAKYANTVKLRQGQVLEAGVDYGSMGQRNYCTEGAAVIQACNAEGTVCAVTWSDVAPESGYWVDTTESEPKLKAWSESQGLWLEANPYLRCAMPNAAKGLRAGDGVDLRSAVNPTESGWQALEQFWSGTHVLVDAWHDPGAANRAEGTDDYVILAGMLPQDYSLQMHEYGRTHFTLDRAVPSMDFVVEAANRLWGCHCGDGVNELYGCKLGDFRNWSVFQGISTDSYRVARGHDGAYTGAAVLGGCPIFFREDSMEKIYPSANGDHGVVTVSLSGIEAGSADSAVVIRDRLYYKSVEGICVYNGTLPTLVSRALGERAYHRAVGAALGTRYYVSMYDETGTPALFVLDTETGCWHREDEFSFLTSYTQDNRLYLLPQIGGAPVCVNEAQDSQNVFWWAETGDLLPKLGVRRQVTRLQLTVKLEVGAEMRIYLRYDGGPWLRKGEVSANRLHTVTLPVRPRRCERLQLRIEGKGGMELHQLTWLTEAMER